MLGKQLSLVIVKSKLDSDAQQILQAFKQYVFAHSGEAVNLAIETFRDLLILRGKYDRLYQQKLVLELENRELKQRIANAQRILDGE